MAPMKSWGKFFAETIELLSFQGADGDMVKRWGDRLQYVRLCNLAILWILREPTQ